jgi:hypothetical protein
LNLRFSEEAASLIESETVIVSDDDLLVPESVVLKLILEREARPKSIVGIDPRWTTISGEYRRKPPNMIGPVALLMRPFVQPDIVLTKTMAFHRHYLDAYNAAEHGNVRRYVTEQRNCEDIAFNFIASSTGATAPTILRSVITLPYFLRYTGIGFLLNSHIRWSLQAPKGISDGGHDIARTGCVRWMQKTVKTRLHSNVRERPKSTEGVVQGAVLSREHRSIVKVEQGQESLRPQVQHDVPRTRALCYASLLYNNSMLTELRVLGLSLIDAGSVNRSVPMIALVTPQIAQDERDVLKSDGWEVLPIDARANPNTNFPGRFDFVYSKLEIFNLHEVGCERVAYLDADTMVYRDPSPLMSRCPGFCVTMRHSERFNSGVMALVPSAELHSQIISLIEVTDSYTGGEQGMLNEIFSDIANAPLLDSDFVANRGEDAFPVQLGVQLARLPAGLNGDLGLYFASKRWAQPGKDSSLFIIHYTMGPFKPAQKLIRFYFPGFTSYGWWEKCQRLSPPPRGGVVPEVQAIVMLGLALALRCLLPYLIKLGRNASNSAWNTMHTPVLCAQQSRFQRLTQRSALGFWLRAVFAISIPSTFIIIIIRATPLTSVPTSPFVSLRSILWYFSFAITYASAVDVFVTVCIRIWSAGINGKNYWAGCWQKVMTTIGVFVVGSTLCLSGKGYLPRLSWFGFWISIGMPVISFFLFGKEFAYRFGFSLFIAMPMISMQVFGAEGVQGHVGRVLPSFAIPEKRDDDRL